MLQVILQPVAVFGTLNVTGGHLPSTAGMFKAKKLRRASQASNRDARRSDEPTTCRDSCHHLLFNFIYGLMGLIGSKTAVRGNRAAAA